MDTEDKWWVGLLIAACVASPCLSAMAAVWWERAQQPAPAIEQKDDDSKP